MFTGIISSIGTVASATQQGDLRIAVACDFAGELKTGESVGCNGVCLTVVQRNDRQFVAELSAETLKRTAPRWNTGDKINLERALKLGDTLDGHIVSGHVDGIATILSITPSKDSRIFQVQAPEALSKFLAEKGSVTLDGVSLTVNRVEGNIFWVNIIPHTLKVTTLGGRNAGDTLNIEIDMLARHVARMMECK